MRGGDYYSRSSTATSGGPAFATDDDGRHEDRIRAAIEAATGVELHRYGGRFNPIDWYATRTGRIVAYLELKTRSHSASRHPTVFLNLRKWLALTLCSTFTGVPSCFVVGFDDGDDVRLVDVALIDASRIAVGGCNRLVKSRTDREPVIHVPVSAMKILNKPTRPEAARSRP